MNGHGVVGVARDIAADHQYGNGKDENLTHGGLVRDATGFVACGHQAGLNGQAAARRIVSGGLSGL
jgi:hypothetical protein